ncbi:uncharacterized protein LOC129316845 isoform X2 [Prosopis cineraria]|uniref:uncharacterized protein LOC129316845 isoform X2 n=1 Tax=Prosopis cineraria TaxID=364024 RepID=UPI00240EE8C2|nr:uncharacterized protein LOC129316845 isoform X2 [Prosopis cineraria]
MEPKQSTIRSTEDKKRQQGASEGSTGTHNIKPTTTDESSQQTTNVNDTTKASRHRYGKDGRRSGGTSGGFAGTHEYPLQCKSVSSQPTNGADVISTEDENRQADASTVTHNNISPSTPCDGSHTTIKTETDEAKTIEGAIWARWIKTARYCGRQFRYT